jgi:hypothetical protein
VTFSKSNDDDYLFTISSSGKKVVNLVSEVTINRDKANQDRFVVEYKVFLYFKNL